jgi:hypothetical protein
MDTYCFVCFVCLFGLQADTCIVENNAWIHLEPKGKMMVTFGDIVRIKGTVRAQGKGVQKIADVVVIGCIRFPSHLKKPLRILCMDVDVDEKQTDPRKVRFTVPQNILANQHNVVANRELYLHLKHECVSYIETYHSCTSPTSTSKDTSTDSGKRTRRSKTTPGVTNRSSGKRIVIFGFIYCFHFS